MAVTEGRGDCTVTFTEGGSLGIKFGWNAAASCVVVLDIVPGSQAAAKQPALAAGQVLASVAGQSVRPRVTRSLPRPLPPPSVHARSPGNQRR